MKHHIHHYSMHNALHHTNLIYFENIIAPCILYIMTLHASNSLPFQERTINRKISSANNRQHLTKYFSPHRVLLPSMVVRVYFLPAESSLPSLFRNGVIFSYRYSCNYHPQRKYKFIPQYQPRIRLPDTRQGFTLLDKNIHETSHTSL